MLNKTTSPKNDENRLFGFPFSLTRELTTLLQFIYLPRGAPEAAAIPLISSLNGLGSVSTIKGCETLQRIQSETLEMKFKKKKKYISRKWEKRRQHSPVQCRPSLSAFRSALKRQPALWWLLSCWPAEENKITILMRFFFWDLEHYCEVFSNDSYICFFVSNHSRPSLAGR